MFDWEANVLGFKRERVVCKSRSTPLYRYCRQLEITTVLLVASGGSLLVVLHHVTFLRTHLRNVKHLYNGFLLLRPQASFNPEHQSNLIALRTGMSGGSYPRLIIVTYCFHSLPYFTMLVDACVFLNHQVLRAIWLQESNLNWQSSGI